MSTEYWKEVLKTSRERLEALLLRRDVLDAEREVVNNEVVQLEQLITTLSEMAEEPFLDETAFIKGVDALSLAEACRKVLEHSKKYITPIEVRNILDLNGYPLNQHTNALASIHGVLKRLVESGEAETLSNETRGTMYRWKSTGTKVHGSVGSGGSYA